MQSMKIRRSHEAPRHIALCDPVCVQSIGHNLAAVNRYSSFLEQLGLSVEAHVSRLIQYDSAAETRLKTNGSFSHYYSSSIQVSTLENDNLSKAINAETAIGLDTLARRTAEAELEEVINKIGEVESPGLFYPSIDFYSLGALVTLLEKNTDRPSLPTFYIRWIGVMENICYGRDAGTELPALCKRLSTLQSGDHAARVRHSAECPSYAAQLEQLLGCRVSITPTLVNEPYIEPRRSEDKFVIAFPGSARIDKGFDRIHDILREFEKICTGLDFTAYIQLLGRNELMHYFNTARDLLRNPRVRCFPAQVSQQELTDYIGESHLLVTPYSSEIYKYRSSAIMAEGACLGRQVVASAGCGFSKEILDLGIGMICTSDVEFAEAIYMYSQASQDEMRNKTLSARKRYQDYIQQSYRHFFDLSE